MAEFPLPLFLYPGIPFRRGYLLYGAPGAGKTSMIHSIAGELGLDIYILSLTVMSLNDNTLKSLISRLPKSCILLTPRAASYDSFGIIDGIRGGV